MPIISILAARHPTRLCHLLLVTLVSLGVPGILGSRALGATLENPQAGSVASGVGVVSGWTCEAERIWVTFDDEQTWEAAYGTPRGDTMRACGDTDNGFVLLINYALLGEGLHLVRVEAEEADGTRTLIRSWPFFVVTFGAKFLRDIPVLYRVIPNFPSPGDRLTVAWQQSAQRFVIEDTSRAGLPASSKSTLPEGTRNTGSMAGVLEVPQAAERPGHGLKLYFCFSVELGMPPQSFWPVALSSTRIALNASEVEALGGSIWGRHRPAICGGL